jgi:predicted fused transcriptional regulator/phosphomethylpyrimidine kinase
MYCTSDSQYRSETRVRWPSEVSRAAAPLGTETTSYGRDRSPSASRRSSHPAAASAAAARRSVERGRMKEDRPADSGRAVHFYPKSSETRNSAAS